MSALSSRAKPTRKPAPPTTDYRWRRLFCEILEDRSVPSNLLTNGSFETPPVSAPGKMVVGAQYPGIPDTIILDDGWKMEGGRAFLAKSGATYSPPPDGSQFLFLNGYGGTFQLAYGLSQEFPTTPGVRYHLRFAAWGDPTTGSNQAMGGFLENLYFVVNSKPTEGWIYHDFTFVATRTIGRISFFGENSFPYGYNGYGPAIDDVSVVADSTADIHMLSASLQAGNRVQFTYETTGNPGTFSVGVYRSSDANFDSGDVLVASTLVTTPSAPGGSPGSIALSQEMPIDPARQFVLAVADPTFGITESNEGNNTSSFRKLAFAAISHGFLPGGTFGGIPSWETTMKNKLLAEGYKHVIAFDWSQTSNLPVQNMATSAGVNLAAQVRTAVAQIATQTTDVVDVHFIGHSRGAVVISQALINLNNNPGSAALSLGYDKMTMLDPHPARNRGALPQGQLLVQGLLELLNGSGQSLVGSFSFDPTFGASRALAISTLVFQFGAQDPNIIIPANVDASESYSQQLRWQDTNTSFELAARFNLWGSLPSAIINLSAHPMVYVDINTFHYGHTGVSDWFTAYVLP